MIVKVIVSLLLGYLLGSVSPAAIIGKIKKVDMRGSGTHNLGATNALVLLGKRYGAVVALADIAKAYLAVQIATLLLPDVPEVQLGAGLAAIVGHCFPFYLRFRGGKGLACFGGVVLAYQPLLLLILLPIAVGIMLLVNYSYVIPFFGTAAFALYVALHTQTWSVSLVALAISLLVFCKHFGNFLKARRGEDIKVRDLIREKFSRS